MIQTKDFRTRAEILSRKMPRVEGKTIVALDGGYSSVKGVSSNHTFLFASYPLKAPVDFEVIGSLDTNAILFKNHETGELWLVGRLAEELTSQEDLDGTTDASLYTRFRYESVGYKVVMAAGLAIGLLGTGAGNEIFLQTGLPAQYKTRDESKLIKALSGNYDISIKIGNGQWNDFQFSLDADHIGVIEQPQGTLCATAYKADGAVSPMGSDIMRSASIIYDVGFGTEDTFSIKSGVKNAHRTYTDTAMRAVFEEVTRQLAEYTDVKVFELQQKYMENGKVTYTDYENGFPTLNDVSFAEILEKANAELCDKSLKRLLDDYDLKSYKYLIVTGGTNEARFKQIEERLATFVQNGLVILPGNLNCQDLPFVYSNVIGYYMVRYAKMMKEVRNSAKEKA